jgi:type I restriction enzyme S subunit
VTLPNKRLAKGWIKTTLGEVTQPNRPKVNPKNYPALPFVGMEHIQAHTMRLLKTVPADTMKSNAVHFVAGDVLYGRLRPYLNKVYRPEFEGLCSAEFIVFPSTEHLATTFLQYFLNSLDFVSFASHLNEGDRPRVDFSQLAPYEFPLAPLPEQDRIVSKIEELFTKLEAGVEELRNVKAQLKRYRQSVLKAALTGELTKDWREAHQGELEPADELLARILKERRKKWEADQLKKMKAAGKEPNSDGWRKKYIEPAEPDTRNQSAPPLGWTWSSLGQTFAVYVGATPSRAKSSYWKGDVHWVSSSEVAFCRIRETRETITELGLKNTSTDLHPTGTVLLGMIGEGKTRGQAAILDVSACNSQNSAAIRVSEADLPPEFIYYFLEGEYERTRTLGSGNNQPALNKSRVQAMLFPLPPIKEQQKIVEELERLFSITEAMEKTIQQGLKQAERMRQSILKKAFEGKLVSQDPNDEPAELLLERIKIERAKREAEKSAASKTNRGRFRKKQNKRIQGVAA